MSISDKGPLAALCLTVLIVAAACSQRGEIVALSNSDVPLVTETVLFGTTREMESVRPLTFGNERSAEVTFARFEVSVPPQRDLGSVKLPNPENPDPEREFLVAQSHQIGSRAKFVSEVNQRLLSGETATNRDGVIFIHGFNTSFAEGLYRQAQLQHDMQRHGATVHFSWPSYAKTSNYLGDRESALYSRDGLAQTIEAVASSNIRSLDLVAHSMGTFLLMETLRGMALSGERAVFNQIGSVVLMSADIDVDVFVSQARPVLEQGVPIYILVSENDKALFLSSVLRGTKDRLGSISDSSVLQGLDVVVVDLSQVDSTEFLGHFKEGNSLALIEFVQQVHAQGGELFTEGRRNGVFGSNVTLIQGRNGVGVIPRTGW